MKKINSRRSYTSALALAFSASLLMGVAVAHSHGHGDHGHGHDREHGNGHDHDHVTGHGAHVHGLAELNLVLEGEGLDIELISPAMNKLGFEHPPRTGEQKEAVDSALATLREGEKMFIMPPAARCRQVRAEVNTDIHGKAKDHHAAKDSHGHDHGHDQHDQGHADFTALWSFHCESPRHLNHIDVGLFDAFPGTHRIRVQAITPRGQFGSELSPSAARLNL